MIYDKTLFPFESKWVTIQGSKLHYIDQGAGIPILFCHPPIGSSFMYRNFIRVLRTNYRCIVPDFPGFGLSESHPDYQFNIFSQSQVLLSLIEKLDLKNIVLLGHDTGGPSGFYAMAQCPQRFKAVIFTDTIIFPVSEYPRIDSMLHVVGSNFFSQLNAFTNLLVRVTFSLGVRTKSLSRKEKAQYRNIFNSTEKRKRMTQMLYSLKTCDTVMHEIKQAFSESINQLPALLIYGEKDPVHQLGIADRIHELMPDSELFLIPGEGHFPHEGQPGKMCQIIDTWLQKVS